MSQRECGNRVNKGVSTVLPKIYKCNYCHNNDNLKHFHDNKQINHRVNFPSPLNNRPSGQY